MTAVKWFEFLTILAAGAKHRTTPHALRQVHAGDALALSREPTNPADRNAVMLLHPSIGHVGYVPRVQAQMVARLLDHGYPVHAHVVSVDPSMHEVIVDLRMRGWPSAQDG
jgi:hypothetical protein